MTTAATEQRQRAILAAHRATLAKMESQLESYATRPNVARPMPRFELQRRITGRRATIRNLERKLAALPAPVVKAEPVAAVKPAKSKPAAAEKPARQRRQPTDFRVQSTPLFNALVAATESAIRESVNLRGYARDVGLHLCELCQSAQVKRDRFLRVSQAHIADAVVNPRTGDPIDRETVHRAVAALIDAFMFRVVTKSRKERARRIVKRYSADGDDRSNSSFYFPFAGGMDEYRRVVQKFEMSIVQATHKAYHAAAVRIKAKSTATPRTVIAPAAPRTLTVPPPLPIAEQHRAAPAVAKSPSPATPAPAPIVAPVAPPVAAPPYMFRPDVVRAREIAAARLADLGVKLPAADFTKFRAMTLEQFRAFALAVPETAKSSPELCNPEGMAALVEIIQAIA